ncbi:MAG TPA: hypothetical protein VGN52_16955 [Burkholderiales bacterium]
MNLRRRSVCAVLAASLATSFAILEDDGVMRPAEGAVIAGLFDDDSRAVRLERTVLFQADTITSAEAFQKAQPTVADIRRVLPAASRLVCADFLRVARQSARLYIPRKSMRPDIRYEYFSAERQRAVFETPPYGWTHFHREYPGINGLRSFSRVGIDRLDGQALLVSHYGCGMTCGIGELTLMRRHGNGWRVAAAETLWLN